MEQVALKCFHSFVPLSGPNPLDDACGKNDDQSAKRRKPTSNKEPISTALIKKIIDKFGSEGASLKDLRIAAFCTSGFAGFFRFSELSNMLCKHIAFLEDHMKIFVPHSKTDGYREENLFTLLKPISSILQFLFCLDIWAKQS